MPLTNPAGSGGGGSTTITGTVSVAPAAASLPVSFPSAQAVMPTAAQITGLTAAQATNSNILDASGSGGWTDVSDAPCIAVRVTATVGGGAITFEVSQDGVSSTGAYYLTMGGSQTASWATGAWTVLTTGAFLIKTPFRYVRARVSTALTGTAAISATTLLVDPLSLGGALQVFNATASNLQAVVSGGAAHSSAASGNPVQMGAKAYTAVDTTLVAGDIVALPATTGQQMVVKAFSPAELDWQYTAGTAGTAVTAATSVAIKAAGAASVRNYLTHFEGTFQTACTVSILDGATVIWAMPVAAGATIDKTFPTPLRGTAATALNFQCSVTQGSNALVNAQGFQSF